MPLEARNTAPIPAAFQKLALRAVSGNTETELRAGGAGGYRLPKPMTQILEERLRGRLGMGAPGPIPLVVEDVRWAISSPLSGPPELGVGAEFVLGAPPKELRIKLEHSINMPVGGEDIFKSLLSRAVDDLCDRFFYHPKVLAFLEAPAEPPKDSALVDEPVKEIGPIVGTKPSAADVEASGRILWGSNQTYTQGTASILLGDSKGAIFVYNMRTSSKYLGARLSIGGMFLNAGSAAFGQLISVGGEVGYNGTQHDDHGYVVAPGFSFLVVPTISTLNLLIPGTYSTQIVTMTAGSNIEIDLPIGTLFGIRGGVFLGTALFAFRASAPAPINSITATGNAGFVKFPFGDAYIQTSTGRVSLGLSFQQIAAGKDGITDAFKNPVINLTYESEAGRGVAYEKESAELAGWGMTSQDIRSTPRSAFVEEGALRANAPPRAAQTPAQLAMPAAAATRSAEAAAVAAAAAPPKTRWVLLGFDPDPEVGAEARVAIRAVIEDAIRSQSQEVVSTGEEQRLRSANAMAEGLESGPTLASAANARFVLYYAVTVVKDEVLIRLRRSDAGAPPDERTRMVPRAQLLDALRTEVDALVPKSP